MAQGLGFALSEELRIDERGRVSNPTFGSYRCLRAEDLPTIETVLLEPAPGCDDEPRSIGEIGINGPAPAVNAMNIQAYYTVRLAMASRMRLAVAKDGADAVLTARG